MPRRIPVGLQLYSIRHDCARDLPGTLAAVAKMGYAGVEFAGYHDRSAGELRRMLDDLGLKCCGTHTQIDTLTGDALKATVEFNKALGNRYLIVPHLKLDSRAAWLDIARRLSEIADAIAGDGMLVGYHNHNHDFAPVEGETPWDILFSNADPRVVMQLDIGNAMRGNADPVAVLRKYPGRAITVHVKEFGGETSKSALIGEGKAPWAEVFAECEKTGRTEWYIVEQESYTHPPLECVRLSLENLRRMGVVG